MRRMTKALLVSVAVAAGCVALVALADPSNVSSYTTPALVQEINDNIVTALNTEAGLKDSTVTTAEIKDATIVNADISSSAAITSNKFAAAVVTQLSKANTALQANTTSLLTEGYLDVVSIGGTNKLIFWAAGVTNILDANIAAP